MTTKTKKTMAPAKTKKMTKRSAEKWKANLKRLNKASNVPVILSNDRTYESFVFVAARIHKHDDDDDNSDDDSEEDEEETDNNNHRGDVISAKLELMLKYNLGECLSMCWSHFDSSEACTQLISLVEPDRRCLSLFEHLVLATRSLVELAKLNTHAHTQAKKLVGKWALEGVVHFIARFAYYDRLHARSVALQDSVNGVFLILLELSEIDFVCCDDDATTQNDSNSEHESAMRTFEARMRWNQLNVEKVLLELNIGGSVADDDDDDQEVTEQRGEEATIRHRRHLLRACVERVLANKRRKRLDESLDSLSIAAQTANYAEACHALCAIYERVSRSSFRNCALFVALNFDRLAVRFLADLHERRHTLDLTTTSVSASSAVDQPAGLAATAHRFTYNQALVGTLHYLLLVINKLVFKSAEMALHLGTYATLSAMVAFVRDLAFMKRAMSDAGCGQHSVVVCLLANLTMMSKYASRNVAEWRGLKVADVLIGLVDELRRSDHETTTGGRGGGERLIELSYYCLCYIGALEPLVRIEKLAGVEYVLEALALEMAQMAKMLMAAAPTSGLKRTVVRVSVEDLNRMGSAVRVLTAYANGRTLTGVLDLLTRFCVASPLAVHLIYKKVNFIKEVLFIFIFYFLKKFLLIQSYAHCYFCY